VLAELAKGTVPWRQPWRAEFGLPRNLDSQKPYRGINVLVLMSSALSAGYPSNWWVTFNQAKELGGHINQGEHGFPIVFYQRAPSEPEEERAGGEHVRLAAHGRAVLKVYTVFNVAQCSDLTAPVAPTLTWQPVEAAEMIVATSEVPLHFTGDSAYYSPAMDAITLPPRAFFEDATGYYGTLMHEFVHSTGHQSRLDRKFGKFGSADYAWEELTAEMGSAMLSVITGVPCPDFPNMAAYLDHWRVRMHRDPQAIGEAASAAQRAVEWLLQKAGIPLPA
jgi:antirestriction protein ArdC